MWIKHFSDRNHAVNLDRSQDQEVERLEDPFRGQNPKASHDPDRDPNLKANLDLDRNPNRRAVRDPGRDPNLDRSQNQSLNRGVDLGQDLDLRVSQIVTEQMICNFICCIFFIWLDKIGKYIMLH